MELQWIDAFFESDMPYEDRIKLFHILGPSGRFHEMILDCYDKPQFYPLIMDCLLNYGSDNAESFFKDVIECFLDNENIGLEDRNEYINMAVQYVDSYMKIKKTLYSSQLKLFDDIREFTTPDEWIKFKNVFPGIEINKSENNQKVLFIEVPTFTKKIKYDVSSISKSHIFFTLEHDVHLVFYKLEQYINNNDNNLFEVKEMSRMSEFIRLESDKPIDLELFTNVVQGLFAELKQLNFEDFKSFLHNKDNSDVLITYLSKLVLDFKLKVNKDSKEKIRKI